MDSGNVYEWRPLTVTTDPAIHLTLQVTVMMHPFETTCLTQQGQ